MQNLMTLLQQIEVLKGKSALPDEAWALIAEQLEEAITEHSKETIDVFTDTLGELWNQILTSASSSVRQAVLHKKESPELAAYTLGQLSFAQLLAMQVGEKRINSDFIDMMHSHLYAKYVRALSKEELTGKELAKIVEEADESVSRKLKILREAGITEYRVVGTSRRNFLTATAKSCLSIEPEPREATPIDLSVHEMLENYKTEHLAPIMKSSQSFALAAA